MRFFRKIVGKSGGLWGKIANFASEVSSKRTGMRFLGNIEAKTDAKGRVFLPSTFRKVLQASGEEQLVMRKDIHQKCLVLYPERVWNKRVDALRATISEWDDEGMMVLRQYMQGAEVTVLDGNGRFLISKRLQKIAEIDQDIQFIGMDDTIEIWSPMNLEKTLKTDEEFGTEFEEIMNVEDNR